MKQRKGYLGNDRIPGPDYVHQYTQAEVEEFAKCAADPVYFVANYMKIVNVDKGLMNIDLYDFQEEMIRSYHNNRFNITMCSRQVGKSTIVIGYFLYLILFNQNYTCCIAANKQPTANELLDRLKLAYEWLPDFLKQGVLVWNKSSIKLANGSRVMASATSSSAVRGGSYNILLLDEFAFVDEHLADKFYTSVFPTISSGKTTKIIMVSTPNGMNLFWKFWEDARRNKNGFKHLEVNWRQVPGRMDSDFEAVTKAAIGPDRWEQEFECSFLGAQGTLISPSKLKNMTPDDPIELREDGNLKIYHLPEQYVVKDEAGEPLLNAEGDQIVAQHTYMITVDTGTGQGLDASVAIVTDVTQVPYKVCAVYRNRYVPTMTFPQVIHELAKYYFNAYVLIEIDSLGQQIADILRWEYEYDNLLAAVSKQRTGQQMTAGFAKTTQFGVKMTKVVKRIGCATLKTLIEEERLICRDYDAIREFSTFVAKGTSFEAEEGHNDDVVMALVVMAWATNQKYFIDLTSTNVRTGLLNAKQSEWQDLPPFGIIDNGVDAIPAPPSWQEGQPILSADGTIPLGAPVPVNDAWLLGGD
jgi:hypothetical protein